MHIDCILCAHLTGFASCAQEPTCCCGGCQSTAVAVSSSRTGCVIHRATFFFDLHCQVFFLPAGLYYCFKALKSPTEPKRDALVFVIMYGLVALYLSGVMIRLLLVLAPVTYCDASACSLTIPLMHTTDDHSLPATVHAPHLCSLCLQYSFSVCIGSLSCPSPLSLTHCHAPSESEH